MLRLLQNRGLYGSIQKSNVSHFHSKSPDVAIIGGGVVGSSVAYHLASRSPGMLRICVIERDYTYKRAATPLSAGGVRHQFSEPVNISMSLYGSQFVKSAKDLLSCDDEEIDIQFVEGGYLFLASQAGQNILHKNHITQSKMGAKVQLLTPDLLEERFPWMNTSGVSVGSLGLEDEGWFDPWAFLQALKKKSTQYGVEFIEAEVVGMERGESNEVREITLKNNCGIEKISVGSVVNAAGPWASNVTELCGLFDIPVRPRKRSVFVFHCHDERVYDGPFSSPLLVDPTGVYFRPEGKGGSFICGVSPPSHTDEDCSSDDALDFPDHHLFDEIIWPVLAERVPSFEAIKLVNSWAGFYDYNTVDQNAIVGKHPACDNMYLANGFSGHGLQQAPAVGRALAELILDGDYQTIDLSELSLSRFELGLPCFEQNIV